MYVQFTSSVLGDCSLIYLFYLIFSNSFKVRLLLFDDDFQVVQEDFYIKWLKTRVLIFFKAIKAEMNINRKLKLYITAKICQNTGFLFHIFPCKGKIYETRDLPYFTPRALY